MDDHEQRLEEILAEWDLDKDHKDVDTYTVDLSGVYSNVSITSPYTVTLGGPNTVFTTASTGIGSPWVQSPPMAGPKITLEGSDADIEINGVSLWKTMQEIANRLNIMQTNPELEEEWDQLRKLGNQYRALEEKLKKQSDVWNKLKAISEIDVSKF
jgi:hypothetical protein